jgi:hypothetical protein
MIKGKRLSLRFLVYNAQLRKLCKPTLAFTLVLSILVESCVAHVQTTSQTKENLEQYRKYLYQKVEIHKKSDEIIVGYLQSVQEDSIVVSAKKNASTQTSLAVSEIKYIKRASNDTATMVLLISGVVVFLFLVSRLPAALGNFPGT